MAQSGYTPILIYASGTATNVPLAADMTSTATGAELAINYADGKLYYKNSSNVVTLLASTSGASGDVVGPASATDNALARFDLTTGKLIQNSVGILSDAGILTGLTGLTSSGPITLSSLTSGRVTFAGASGLLTDSASFTYNGTNLSVNGATITGGGAQIAGGAWSVVPYVFNSLTIDNSSGAARFFATGANSSTYGSYIWYGGLTTGATSEYMTLTTSGNLGIGISNPTARLQLFKGVSGSGAIADSALALQYDATTTYGRHFMDGNGTYVIYAPSGGVSGGNLNLWATNSILFRTAGTSTDNAEMILDSTGNLSLGGFLPSAWRSTDRAFEIGSVGKSLMAPASGNSIYLSTNWYISTAPANVYAANGLATRYAQSDGVHTWWNAPNNTSGAGAALTFTQAMTLNDSGNLSLSITPSSWGSTYKAFQAGGYAAYVGDGNNGYAEILNNAYASNNNIFNYYDTNSAGRYSIQLGVHKWFSVGSGSANAVITWTQAMTLDASGQLSVGTTSAFARLTTSQSPGSAGQVNGQIAMTHAGATTAYFISTIRGAATNEPEGLTFKENATERMRIDSSGNLLVGTTSALSQVARATVVGAGNAFVAQCGNGTTALQTTNTSGTGTYYAAIFGNNGNTFSTCGIISVSGSTTTYDTASSTSVGAQLNASGITFRPTQSASADANTLDDYEEGTWTPVLQFDANTQSITVNVATYVKIGKAVNINMQITWTAKSGSGRVYITGLPFAKEAAGTVAVMGACLGGSVTTTEALFFNIDGSQTVLNFAQQTGDISSGSLATGGSLMCTGTYFV
jgi:hypothetical protein